MSAPLSDCRFAGFSRWNGFHANRVASSYQGEDEAEVSFRLQKPLTSILAPCEKGEARRAGTLALVSRHSPSTNVLAHDT